MMEILSKPWPWYVAGPLIGLVVPFVYWYGGKKWGVSSSLRHLCAATLPGRIDYFRYDWRSKGAWHLAMAGGMVLGGILAVTILKNPVSMIAIAESTRSDLLALGLNDLDGLVPRELFRWGTVWTLPGAVVIGVGGFLVGFGARYANGCTSGHAISGLSNLQLSSLVVVLGFFVGGLISAHLLLPWVL